MEGWLRQMEVPRDVWEDGTGYAELDLGLAKRWSTAGRFDVFRRLSGDEPGAVNRRTDYGIDSHRYNASVSFAPSHFSRLRLNYSLHQITEETVKDNFEDNHMVAFQLEVAVGKHGAHPY
ncbi:MAG: hypothetical protein M5R36_12840 [Deltaproteobacteria bacterium]|nr:hypothetical protein [Deltaproteobacteria bacterium]